MSAVLVLGTEESVLTGALPLALGLAALAGLVSFASPCVLPLVPGYLGYVTGLSGEPLAERSRPRLVLGALLFVLGFSVVFILGALFVTSIGRVLVDERDLLMRIGGILVILMGLVFLGAGRRLGAQREARLHWRPRAGLLGAPLLGGVFALGWAPCIGPTLAAIISMSWNLGDPARAGLLGLAYSLGLGIPFLILAAGWGWASRSVTFLRRHIRALNIIGGAMLIALGLLMVTGLWTALMSQLQQVVINVPLPL